MADIAKAANRAERSAEVWRLHCQGYKQTEIAKRLGISQPAVSRYLSKVEEWYQLFSDQNKVERHRARQVAELALIRREAWEAWEKSKVDGKTLTQEKSGSVNPDDGGGGSVSRSKLSTRVKSREGDTRYLDIVLRALSREAALLGVDAPVRHDVKIRAAVDVENMTDEELQAIISKGIDATIIQDAEIVTPLQIEDGGKTEN